VTARHATATSGQQYVSFDVEIDDMMRHGIYVDGGNRQLTTLLNVRCGPAAARTDVGRPDE
jgi:hypothetical protein